MSKEALVMTVANKQSEAVMREDAGTRLLGLNVVWKWAPLDF